MKNDAVEQRTGPGRVDEVVQSIAEKLAVSCPFCLTMMSDGLAASDSHLQVRDISELLFEALG
jgi:Fe-S oxidoreductase